MICVGRGRARGRGPVEKAFDFESVGESSGRILAFFGRRSSKCRARAITLLSTTNSVP